MPIRFRCPECNALLGIATRKQGTTIHCPKCCQQIVVPITHDAPSDSKQADWHWSPPGKHSGEAEIDPGVFNFEDEPKEEILSVVPVFETLPVRVQPPPPRQPTPPPPINHPGEFVQIQRRRKGRTFPYLCNGCGTVVELRQRVTQTKRSCPGCGKEITIASIDSQVEVIVARGQKAGCATMLLSVAATLLVAYLLVL